jgi:hypothetical protein
MTAPLCPHGHDSQTIKQVCLGAVLALALCAGGNAYATTLYDLDFTAPDTGTYSTVFGSPVVVSSFDGLSDALMFHAVQTIDQVRLNLGTGAPGYQIGFDVVTHGLTGSPYAFRALLDSMAPHSVALNGGFNDLEVFQSSPFTSQSLQPFADDTVYHLGITLDFAANLWTVSVNNVPSFSNPINLSDIDSIRFSLAPSISGAGNYPGTQVAIDNIMVEAIPEPSAYALVFGSLMLLGLRLLHAIASRHSPVRS